MDKHLFDPRVDRSRTSVLQSAQVSDRTRVRVRWSAVTDRGEDEMSAARVLEDLEDLDRQGTGPAPTARHLRLVAADEGLPPAPRAAATRLTRRGRLVITCTVALLLVLAVGGLAGAVIPGGEPETVIVGPG